MTVQLRLGSIFFSKSKKDFGGYGLLIEKNNHGMIRHAFLTLGVSNEL